jgi:hypothetical protein
MSADDVADELTRAGWRPSIRYAGRWDSPCSKLKGIPHLRALEIARRDARRDAGESSQTRETA